MKIKNFRDIAGLCDKSFTGIIEWCDGINQSSYIMQVRYMKNKKPHREDGPAVEYADGSKEWWLDGKFFPEEELAFKRTK
jgi:hypothetical protein